MNARNTQTIGFPVPYLHACDRRRRARNTTALGLASLASVALVPAVCMGLGVDFGDSPEPYPTTLSADGARHTIVLDWQLGKRIDSEPDGQPSANADGDDITTSDDEEGVYLWDGSQFQSLDSANTFRANNIFALGVVASTNGYLNAWMDFNCNGSWADPGEQIATNVWLIRGTNAIPIHIPASASNGLSFARFRFGSQTGLSYTGLADDGEVEDYDVYLVRALDFGDAPQPYPTTLADNGARHLGVRGWSLGNGPTLDFETDGQPTGSADGDDSSMSDDEDGVYVWEAGQYWSLDSANMFRANNTSTLGVVASTNGYLNAWMDFNCNGSWADPGEQIVTNLLLIRGTNAVAVHIPASASNGLSFARFRFGSQTGLSYTGLADDGEVEDYDVCLERALDFGDAPQPYPTTLADNGARHLGVWGWWLGNGPTLDFETDGQPTGSADGDDNNMSDDEDGVYVWEAGQYWSLDSANMFRANNTSTLGVVASTNGYLNAWMDFNCNGSWADPGEQIVTNLLLIRGTNAVAVHIPASASNGLSFARFRFGSQTGLSPTGLADDGEVEDYDVCLERALDFGDAPMPYPTTLSDNGARHLGVWGWWLGNGPTLDFEADGQQSGNADGDDNNMSDDEDGVYVWEAGQYWSLDSVNMFRANNDYTLGVVASTNGYLNAWMDFNCNGSWADPGEQIVTNLLLTPGTNAVPVHIPATASDGLSFARFRFGSQTGLSPTGLADDGEVEDYDVCLVRALDFGDALSMFFPTYPTRLSDNGARHLLVRGWHLGLNVDYEQDGQPTYAADGDDKMGAPNDEDGVFVWDGGQYNPLQYAPLQANNIYRIGVVASTGGYLNAWMDFNLNGSWDDPGEQIATDVLVGAGTNALTVHIPASAGGGQSSARFRFSSQTGLAPAGLANDGEVEDYVVSMERRIDFGDAGTIEMPTYPTRLMDDGARHLIVSGWCLGTNIDYESDGQPTSAADGDDKTGSPNDEDGVFVWDGMRYNPLQYAPLQANNIYRIGVVATTNGYLNAWLDFNINRNWGDPGEQIFTNVLLTVGTNALTLRIPASASSGQSFARFRFSSQTGLAPSGLADDGEVEDYAVLLERRLDFGDAGSFEMPTYPTMLADDGARHLIVSGWCLGTNIDYESDGQPNSAADGDDRTGSPNDEDGVFAWDGMRYNPLQYAPLQANDIHRIGVVATTNGYLNAWLDFNINRNWGDPGEQIFTNVLLTVGTNALTLHVPASASNGLTCARFRFSSRTDLSCTGLADDGEVEDYAVILERRMDFGDAPQPYPTLLADNGARHLGVRGWWLGNGPTLDFDADGQPSFDASGDDNNMSDDEDGAYLWDAGKYWPLDSGGIFMANNNSLLGVVASTNGYLNAWIDFNRNGSWADPGEQIATNLLLIPGTNAIPIHVPATASNGISFARFRFGSQTGLSYAGLADDGEVEDYDVCLERALDFGDAPMPYPTTLADDGARHLGVRGWYLGNGPTQDFEPDGQPSFDASGDDNNMSDDEDGVYVWEVGQYWSLDSANMFRANNNYTLGVVASTNGYLNAWMDFNCNGSWADPGEQIATNLLLTPGTNAIAVHIPATTSNGSSFARFRFGSQTGLSYTGLADDGEVEDYDVTLERVLDFGDAPQPYPTLLADNGARHLGVRGWWLGNGPTLDFEPDGLPSPDASGDDGNMSDDEDGVFVRMGPDYAPLDIVNYFRANGACTFGVVASTNGYLNAWMDFNRNGSWADPGEQIATNLLLIPGTNAIPVRIPTSASNGLSFARFRFGSQTGLSYAGLADDGEVEDYDVFLQPPIEIGRIVTNAGATVTLEWSDAGTVYTVEATTNLVDPTWGPVEGTWPTTATNWTSPGAITNSPTFFRVISL